MKKTLLFVYLCFAVNINASWDSFHDTYLISELKFLNELIEKNKDFIDQDDLLIMNGHLNSCVEYLEFRVTQNVPTILWN